MATIFLFRGKAATGKTSMTNLLSKKVNISVLRKDDIYDELSKLNLGHQINNMASYDVLARLIQTNIDLNCDLIIDISLAHNPYLKQFLSKVDFKESEVFQFFCTCSNAKEWRNRIRERLDNPAPNQAFKSVEEAEKYYKKLDITPLENEIILDSSVDISINMKKVYEAVRLTCS